MMTKLPKFFSPDETKIIVFLIFFAAIGFVISYTDALPDKAEIAMADSLNTVLKVDELPQFDIRTASQAELECIDGIGPAKAKAIVEYRKTKGFETVEDLQKVRGIGKKSFAKILPYLKNWQAKKIVADKCINEKIILNQASVEQLECLDGIGPVKAARIVQMRTKMGGFKKFDDLLNVKGIGPKTLLKIKKMATLGKQK